MRVAVDLDDLTAPLSRRAVVAARPAATGDAAASPRTRHRMRPRCGCSRARTVASSLDLRGARVEEALETLARYLDDAGLAGLRSVVIIHGLGTGALRDAVRAGGRRRIRSCPSVRPGERGEGGDGATIVELLARPDRGRRPVRTASLGWLRRLGRRSGHAATAAATAATALVGRVRGRGRAGDRRRGGDGVGRIRSAAARRTAAVPAGRSWSARTARPTIARTGRSRVVEVRGPRARGRRARRDPSRRAPPRPCSAFCQFGKLLSTSERSKKPLVTFGPTQPSCHSRPDASSTSSEIRIVSFLVGTVPGRNSSLDGLRRERPRLEAGERVDGGALEPARGLELRDRLALADRRP